MCNMGFMILRRALSPILFCTLAFAHGEDETNPLEGAAIIPITFDSQNKNLKDAPIEQDSPEHAAKSYLECLRADREIPARLIARSNYIKQDRREAIDKSEKYLSYLVSRNAAALKGRQYAPEFTLFNTEKDKDLAVCFFQVYTPDYPLTFTGSALALLQKDGLWKVSQTTGSFDNAGLPFTGDARDRAKNLTANINGKVKEHLEKTKNERLEQLSSEVEKLRKANAGKSRRELLMQLADAIKHRNIVAMAALMNIESVPDGDQPARERLLKFLKEANMLVENIKTSEYSSLPPVLDKAAELSNVIIPIENDGQPANKRSLGIVSVNRHSYFGIRGNMPTPETVFFTLDVYDPEQPGQQPFFYKKLDESLPNGSDMISEEAEKNIFGKIINNFHTYYPSREWDSPEMAAREILPMCTNGDVTGLLQSIDPAFLATDNTKLAKVALDFICQLVLSTQLPYKYIDEENSFSSFKGSVVTSYLHYIINPFTPPVSSAIVYVKPDGHEAYVLADAPESASIQGVSKIRFKLVKNNNGKWILSVYPGDFPTLTTQRQPFKYNLIEILNAKNKPTVFNNDPFLIACTEHFFAAKQEE